MLDWELRIAVGRRLIKWGLATPIPNELWGVGGVDDPVYSHLAWLLNYHDGLDLMYNFREADRDKLKMLLSPHGLTIYKMLVVKKNAQDTAHV